MEKIYVKIGINRIIDFSLNINSLMHYRVKSLQYFSTRLMKMFAKYGAQVVFNFIKIYLTIVIKKCRN